MSEARPLAGSSVWITGAGSGIGRAMALQFAQAGALVTLTGRHREPLDEVASAIAATGKGRARVAPADILDREEMTRIVERILADHGRLDTVCNNAGVNIPHRTFGDIDWESWDHLLDINIKGVLNVIAASLPPMRAQKDGVIITTSSWAGRFYSQVSGVPYAASKHAVQSINASLNMDEGRHGIRGTVLCPAEVATPLLMRRPGFDPAQAETIIQPDDLAAMAVHVAGANPNIAVHEILVAPVRGKA